MIPRSVQVTLLRSNCLRSREPVGQERRALRPDGGHLAWGGAGNSPSCPVLRTDYLAPRRGVVTLALASRVCAPVMSAELAPVRNYCHDLA